MGKLILIMIDGISAELFEKHRKFLPHLDALAKNGTQVTSVTPEICGTSMPGRSSIITGTAPSDHGVYGNKIFDPKENRFRWANPYDIQGKTIATYAHEQGLNVTNLGYGMIRPEDCSLYYAPWWVGELIIRGRDQKPKPSDRNWLNAIDLKDPDDILGPLFESGHAKSVIDPADDPDHLLELGMLADQQFINIAAALTASDQQPDLITLEVAITDYYLHKFGTDHPLTEHSLHVADAQVGSLITQMERSGSLDDYNFLILSDHGHAEMSQGIYLDNLLDDDVVWSSEGGMLYVKPKDQQQADKVTAQLTEQSMELWNNDHIPTDMKSQLLTFAVPEGADLSFEKAVDGSKDIFGPSRYKSNHGMRPGREEDFRFCIFNGPDIKNQQLPHSQNISIPPTMASILGVETDWTAEALSVLQEK